jgi:hypothetical protein
MVINILKGLAASIFRGNQAESAAWEKVGIVYGRDKKGD